MKSSTIFFLLLTIFLFRQNAMAQEVKTSKASYDGIGIVIKVADSTEKSRMQSQLPLKISETHPLLVKEVLSNSPAAKSGLRPNDRILKINGTSVIGLTAEEAATKMRGEPNLEVKLTFQRGATQKLQSVCLVRSNIR